jgi:hypothetical protein
LAYWLYNLFNSSLTLHECTSKKGDGGEKESSPPIFLCSGQATKGFTELVGTGCGAMVALNAVKASNDVLHLHTRDKAANALQIAITPAIELYVGNNTILDLYIDMSGAGALCFIRYFHKYIYRETHPIPLCQGGDLDSKSISTPSPP